MDGQLIDLVPRLRQKQASQCTHEHADVDLTAASLVCRSCGLEIDPWWFLRKLANDEAGEQLRRETAQQEYARWHANALDVAKRIEAEIQALTETMNRLRNEQVGGQSVGAAMVRSRRRAPKAR